MADGQKPGQAVGLNFSENSPNPSPITAYHERYSFRWQLCKILRVPESFLLDFIQKYTRLKRQLECVQF